MNSKLMQSMHCNTLEIDCCGLREKLQLDEPKPIKAHCAVSTGRRSCCGHRVPLIWTNSPAPVSTFFLGGLRLH